MLGPRRRMNRFASFEVVGRHHQRDVVNRSQRVQIMQRVMRTAESAVTDASADAYDNCRYVGVANVVLDLLQG